MSQVPPRFREQGCPAQTGFTLVETLVALLVLAVGMLGLVTLFAETLRLDRTALHRGLALDLATNMAERIQANPAAGVAYQEPGIDLGCGDGGADRECTPEQLAAQDIFDWQQAAGATLPSGQGVLRYMPPAGENPGRYTLDLSWSETGDTGRQRLVIAVEN